MTKGYLLVPGYTGSGEQHWQSLMQRTYSNVESVQQDNWLEPQRDIWMRRLAQTIALSNATELCLVGHSCGAVTVAQWAATHKDAKVTKLVLVAPADIEAATALSPFEMQRPLPHTGLGLPTLLICSDNDPYLSVARAEYLAAR